MDQLDALSYKLHTSSKSMKHSFKFWLFYGLYYHTHIGCDMQRTKLNISATTFTFLQIDLCHLWSFDKVILGKVCPEHSYLPYFLLLRITSAITQIQLSLDRNRPYQFRHSASNFPCAILLMPARNACQNVKAFPVVSACNGTTVTLKHASSWEHMCTSSHASLRTGRRLSNLQSSGSPDLTVPNVSIFYRHKPWYITYVAKQFLLKVLKTSVDVWVS